MGPHCPLLPPHKPRGWTGRGPTLEGILGVRKTGSRWQNLPRAYGRKTRRHRRLKEGQEQGVWEGVLRASLAALDEAGRLRWERALCHLCAGQEVEGQGLPLGVRVESAQGSEVRLAEEAWRQVWVPRRVGRPRRWWQTGAMTGRLCGAGCGRGASGPAPPGGRTPGSGLGGSRILRATGSGGW